MEGKKITGVVKDINEFTPVELYKKNPEFDGFKVDIFSLGIFLFELLYRIRPFKIPLDGCPVCDCIKEGKSEVFWSEMKDDNNIKPNESFKQLFQGMVTPNPDYRYSIKKVIDHDWFGDTIKSF